MKFLHSFLPPVAMTIAMLSFAHVPAADLGIDPVSQNLTKKLDYTTVAVPLSRALADLSKQAGTQLMVTQDLANQVIVLRLKGVTTDEAMKRIASTVGAEWHTAHGGFELVRPEGLAAKLREQGLAARANGITKMIDQQLKLAEAGQVSTAADAARLADRLYQAAVQQEGDSSAWPTFQQVRNTTPEYRAIWKVLSSIDPRAIAGMESSQRLVFSNKPTAMQQPISADLTDVGLQMQEQQNLVADAFKKLEKPGGGPQTFKFGRPPVDPMSSAPVRFVIGVQLVFLSQSYVIDMIGFDANNSVVVTCHVSMDVISDFGGIMADRARVAKANISEPDLAVSPMVQEMLDFMKKSMAGGGGGGDVRLPDGALRAALLKPEERDPLAYIYSEGLLGIAERRNVNLVAYPDDSAFLIGMFAGMEGKLKPSLIMQTITGLGPMVPTNVLEQDGWLTIAPVDLEAAERSRTSRVALGNFLRAYDQAGFLSLDMVGNLVASVTSRELPVLDLFLPMMMDPTAHLDQCGDLGMLKLYGSLDQGQMTRLTSKQAIRVAELRPEQAALVSRYVYEGKDPAHHFGQGSSDAAAESEPTEALPSGLPDVSTVSMTSDDENVYFVKQSINGSTYTSPMNISALGWTVSQKDHPTGSPEFRPTVLSIQPGVQRTVHFVISTGTMARFESALKEQRTVQGGPWTLDNLPAAVKKELDKAVAMYSNLPGQAGQDSAPIPAPAAPPSS